MLYLNICYCCSVDKSYLTLIWSHGLQHPRLPCPSQSLRVCPNSCPLSLWCYLTISSPATLPPPALSLSCIRVFSSELVLRIRWPKYWGFSVSISPSNNYLGLISFRIDWFDLAVQGTLKSLLQHHNLKESILWHSAFFMAQLSHYICTHTGKPSLCQQSDVSVF